MLRLRPTASIGVAISLSIAAAAAIVTFSAPIFDVGTAVGDWRPLAICFGLIGLNVVTYLAWFSRYNIVAHAQLVFCVVAYIIPIFSLRSLEGVPPDVLDAYAKVVLIGFLIAAVGTILGSTLISERVALKWSSGFSFGDQSSRRLESQVGLLTLGATLGVLASFAYMGFIPALAPDPLVAKFFRGAYAAAYQPVAPLYRASTSVIALLLPLVGRIAWKRKSLAWTSLLIAALGVLLFGLLRDPAASGLLLLAGAALAVRGRGLPLYFALLIGAYFVGAALYALLASVGVANFGDAPNDQSVLAQVASGAPDVRDQAQFLGAWLAHPELTLGRTWVGGLVPGNYMWNSSVWSLGVVNPGVPIERINSGGLRLPAPIWGLVSFGWVGVVVVSFLFGLTAGFLARLFSFIVKGKGLTEVLCWIVLYAALLDVVGSFYRLQYLSVLQLGLIYWLITRLRQTRERQLQPASSPGGGARVSANHLDVAQRFS